jgi:hypothetical protein
VFADVGLEHGADCSPVRPHIFENDFHAMSSQMVP